jgi:predicted DCC family thiol-disulfide oxidoreductase YuxK
MTVAPIADKPFDIEVFYDGGCPLCVREMHALQRWDKTNRIKFTDIDAPDFNPVNLGITQRELMAQMHGRLPDGTWLRGVEVFRRLYAAMGFRWLVALSRLPILSHGLNAGYWLFAKNRLWLTGRCSHGSCSLNGAGQMHENAG